MVDLRLRISLRSSRTIWSNCRIDFMSPFLVDWRQASVFGPLIERPNTERRRNRCKRSYDDVFNKSPFRVVSGPFGTTIRASMSQPTG